MSKKDKITDKIELRKATNPALLKFSSGMSELIEAIPQLLELEKAKSKIRKGRFDSLIKSGFTEQQAIAIVSNTKVFE